MKKTKKKYFLSFVEEGILNPVFSGYIGGRCEVYSEESVYAEDEIRFFTKNKEAFRVFRKKWDFRDVTEKDLREVRYALENEFQDYQELNAYFKKRYGNETR